MPLFRNKSKKPVTILYKGRKMRVRPLGTIEGPKQFSAYKDLEIVGDKTVIDPTKKLTNYQDRPVIKENTNARVDIRKKSILQKTTRPIMSPNGLMRLPDVIVTVTNDYDRNVEIDNTIKHLKKWKEKPSVGICILTKDSYKLITDCCNSILDKVDYKNTKIYIFDTGSKERDVLTFYNKLKKNDKFPVDVIKVGKYQFSKNYNVGISKVDTDFVIIQNNDTVALNDYVTEMVKVANIEKVGVTGPRMLYKDMRIQHDGQHLYDAEGKFTNPGHVNLGMLHKNTPQGIHKVDGITGAGLMVRRQLFNKINFDENYKDIYQDVEFNMRVRMNDKICICNRDAVIHHYDNTSRKKNWSQSGEISKMRDDSNYLVNKMHNKNVHYKKRGTHAFSIVTVVSNKEQYFDFLEDIRKQDFHGPIEIIAIPNFNNEYKSCAEGLNVGLDLVESKFTILCHQDLRVEKDWLSKIYRSIKDLEKHNWGVLGMAGASLTQHSDFGTMYLTNEYRDEGKCHEVFSKQFGDIAKVQCLDELCLVVRSNVSIRFDERTCDHYHWYGVDFCLQYIKNGFENFAINAPCNHLSDGYSNLKIESHKKEYLNGAKKIYNKWKPYFPQFRTLTARFGVGQDLVYFFVASELNKRGIDFPETIKTS